MRLVLPNIDVEVSRKKVSTSNLLEPPTIVMRRNSDNREVVRKAWSEKGQIYLDGWEWRNVAQRTHEEMEALDEAFKVEWSKKIKANPELDTQADFDLFLLKNYPSLFVQVEKEDTDSFILKQKDDGEFEELPFTPPRKQTTEIDVSNPEDLVPKTFLSKFLIEATYEIFAKVKKNRKKGTSTVDKLVQAKLWKEAQKWGEEGVMGIMSDWTWGRGSPKRFYVIVYPVLLQTVMVNDKPKKVAVQKIEDADSFLWIMHTTAVGVDYPNAMEIPVKMVAEEIQKPIVQTTASLSSILG